MGLKHRVTPILGIACGEVLCVSWRPKLGGDQFRVAGSLADRHDCHQLRSELSQMMAAPTHRTRTVQTL